MVLRKLLLWSIITSCVLPPPAWGADSSSTQEATTLFVYPSNHGFLHQTGQHVPYGWAAMYRIHSPGYFIEGQVKGGDKLPAGIYRYGYSFKLLPGQLGGLLSNADDVIRIEAWDATTHECLMSRTFQVSDFLPMRRRPIVKSIVFSTHGRSGHLFEPRVYWPGLSGVFLQRVTVEQLTNYDPTALAAKADRFETAMADLYLDRGYVVCRNAKGEPEDVADAAIWTGMYAASQAWRYEATRSPEALERMHKSLRALHHLYVLSPDPGTLVRYIDSLGRVHPQAASKDTYTGFFFAVAQCLPLVRDKVLRQQLRDDIDGMAAHFLDHDLAFIPARGSRVDLHPALSPHQISDVLDELQRDPGARRRLIRILEAVNFYFLSHGQRPWPELRSMTQYLKQGDFSAVRAHMVPFLNGALRALRQLQANVHRSAILWRWEDAPYQKLDRLLLQMLNQLAPSGTQEIRRPQDLRFLASQSAHALHLIKMASEILPKPNRYQRYYQDNLWAQEGLLKTAIEWNSMDEDLVAVAAGEAQAAASRSSSGHLSYLALFDLFTKEKDRSLKKNYAALFERQFRPQRADFNAMLHVMQPIFGGAPTQTGLAFWSLTLYPEDRRGKGEAYWRMHWQERAARYGGEVSGQARDPLPLNERQRDPFIWQRSARGLRGDNASLTYPPLDYLFVYWMARANGQIPAQER